MRVISRTKQQQPLFFKKNRHERKLSGATTAEDEDTSVASSCSNSISSCPEINSARKIVRFDMDAAKECCIPSRRELSSGDLWWTAAELKQTRQQLENFVNACRKQLHTCPSLLSDKQHQQACRDLQGIVRATQQILNNSNNNRRSEKAAAQLHDCLQRAPSVCSVERRLVPQCETVVKRHVRVVCQAQARCSSQSLAQKAVVLSAASVQLAAVLGRHDAAGQAV